MNTAVLTARLVLVAVFAVAGVAKLADRAGSRQAMRAFGVPEQLAGPVSLVLPLIELGVAGALVASASARWGALAAGALLLAFGAAIARAMARGEHPDCHCFGQVHSAPAGPAALGRNVLLVGMAGFVAVAGWRNAGTSATAWIASRDANQVVGLIAGVLIVGAIVLLGFCCFQLVLQHGRLLLRLERLEQAVGVRIPASAPGLPVGTRAPRFSHPSLDGSPTALDDLLGFGLPVMLIFSDPGCGPCEALLPAIGRWRASHPDRFTLAVVSRGSVQRDKWGEHGIDRVLFEADRETSDAYHAVRTPAAVVIAEDGTIASNLAEGSDQVTALADRYAQGAFAPIPVPAGNGGSADPMITGVANHEPYVGVIDGERGL